MNKHTMQIREPTKGEQLLYNRIEMLEAEYNKERDRADRAEAVLSILIDTVAGGEVITPNSWLRTAKPLQYYSSGDGRDDDLTVVVVYDTARAAAEDGRP